MGTPTLATYGLLLSAAAALQVQAPPALRAAARISPCVSAAFAHDGCVVLRGAMALSLSGGGALPPLTHPGRISSDREAAGVAREASIAAALSCELLDAPAVCDPVGFWGRGYDDTYTHYQSAAYYRSRYKGDVALVVMPRYPMTLMFGLGVPRNADAAFLNHLLRRSNERTGYAAFSCAEPPLEHSSARGSRCAAAPRPTPRLLT